MTLHRSPRAPSLRNPACPSRRARSWLARSWFAQGVVLSAMLTLASPVGRAQPAGKQPVSKPQLNLTDRANQKLAADAARLGRQAEGVLPLLELLETWDQSTPNHTLALLEGLARDKRLSPARAVMVQTLLEQARTRIGERPAAEPAHAPGKADASSAQAALDAYEALGYVTRYRVIGPFDNEGKAGFETATPVEQDTLAPADLTASYPGRERAVRWRTLPEQVIRRGYLPLGALLRPRQNVCALAETFVHSETAQAVTLWVGNGGAMKIWWNGQEVLRDDAYRLPSPDRHVAVVGAHKGDNRVLIKACATAGTLGVFLRVGAADGGLAKGVRSSHTLASGAPLQAGHGLTSLPSAPEAPLSALERKASSQTAKAVFTLARFLRVTGADDPAERRVKQLAAKAAELEPSLPHLKLAAEAAEERAEIMRYAAQAFAKYGKQPEAVLIQARVTARGPLPEDALPLIERIPRGDPSWPPAQLLRATILRDLELPRLALKVVGEVREVVGDTAEVLSALASLHQGASEPSAAIDMYKRVLALRTDDSNTRRALISDALRRGALPEVHEHLEALIDGGAGNTQSLLYIASIYDALERDDLVLATYRAGIDLVPEAPELHVAYGRALLRADQPELAAEALTQALALRPQDAQTRELLDQIRPRARADEAYAVPSDELLKLRDSRDGYSSTVLSTLRVSTVFENGLGSSFFQHAAEVHDDEGARRYRTFPIQYDPDAQRVDVRLARVYRKDGRTLEAVRSFEQQLGEPWYRIYYDTRALVVVFPDLQPGDVVEIRYRIDDVAHRNLFADYFGDMHPLQSHSPTRRSEYVLITPSSRKFYVHKPKFEGFSHKQTVDGARRIDHFRVDNLPAIVAESGMPGLTETSPYLHISTYDSWKSVGRWYWGLIRDQLYADASLKATVAQLVAGASSTREKVERIHRWVVTNTRYVGLEFGIHGFLPYRVPLIVQRGFGDCKDKASLTYTMLREAGVDARIVLVRTRRNGALDPSPASLAAFDHAISYVPELDLYLDGTAEHSGTRELPVEDQGVMVLLVGPEGAELRTTPVLSAAENLRTRTLQIELAGDGSAVVDGKESVAGGEAAGYRAHYEAVGTRKERFERALAELYPGLSLDAQSFNAPFDIEQPIEYSYRIKVPQLATLDGDTLRLAPSAMRELMGMARLPTRRYPLDLRGNRSYREERTVRLPKGMALSTLPPGGEARSPFGTLKLALDRQGDLVTARTELEIVRDKIAPADYAEFRRWVQAADELLRQRIGIRTDLERKAP